MLDAKSLEVLQSLKSDIKASKEIFKGRVKGTGRTFGFVVSDQGEEHFLPPDEMTKVFPGDEVTFTVSEQSDGKTRAELETLVKSDFVQFNGVFHVRGKAQGVEPFNEAFAGWLFVPPKQVAGAQSNDIVIARVTRHPWETGKAQAEVIETLGSANNNRSWYSMTLKEAGVPEKFTEEEVAEAENIAATDIQTRINHTDLTALPFVTIDSESTRDMDDALCAEPTDSGWVLHVAIADAAEFIAPDSLLDKAALRRLTTTYLPGLTLPMIPEVLANDAISLKADVDRQAMVFHLDVAASGQVTGMTVEQAKIRSRGKLSYDAVSDWLMTDTAPETYATTIRDLQAVTSALGRWRAEHANVMQDRVDYRIRVDDNFDVSRIDIEPRNQARDIVEEAMLATNAEVARYLADDNALFMTHAGFKADRETELKGLLRDYAPSVSELNCHDLNDFRRIYAVAATTTDFPLLSVLQKRFDRGQWSTQASAHFGLGFDYYTNATSPIRKYTDLIVHRILKAKLAGNALPETQSVAETLAERGNSSRQVANAIENRLRLKWLAQQPKQTYQATVVHINANGLIMQLDDNGISGLLDLRKKKDQYSYDPLRMMIKFEDYDYRLGQQLQVQISKLDENNLTLALA